MLKSQCLLYTVLPTASPSSSASLEGGDGLRSMAPGPAASPAPTRRRPERRLRSRRPTALPQRHLPAGAPSPPRLPPVPGEDARTQDKADDSESWKRSSFFIGLHEGGGTGERSKFNISWEGLRACSGWDHRLFCPMRWPLGRAGCPPRLCRLYRSARAPGHRCKDSTPEPPAPRRHPAASRGPAPCRLPPSWNNIPSIPLLDAELCVYREGFRSDWGAWIATYSLLTRWMPLPDRFGCPSTTGSSPGSIVIATSVEILVSTNVVCITHVPVCSPHILCAWRTERGDINFDVPFQQQPSNRFSQKPMAAAGPESPMCPQGSLCVPGTPQKNLSNQPLLKEGRLAKQKRRDSLWRIS